MELSISASVLWATGAESDARRVKVGLDVAKLIPQKLRRLFHREQIAVGVELGFVLQQVGVLVVRKALSFGVAHQCVKTLRQSEDANCKLFIQLIKCCEPKLGPGDRSP